MLKMRLRRMGAKHQPSYRIVVAESSSPRDGRFVEIVPDHRVMLQGIFQSQDPAFSGLMTMIWSVAVRENGCEVTMSAENVPSGIGEADHVEGMGSSLANLDKLVER